MQEPIHLFVGTSANGEDADAELVFEYTIKQHSDRDIRLHWCRQSNDDASFWSRNKQFETCQWATPWQGFKYAIPEFCEFTGKSIYFDIGIMNNRDIGKLFDFEVPDDKWMLTTHDSKGVADLSVILFDNSKFKDKLPSVKTWGQIPSIDLQLRGFFTLPNRNLSYTVGNLPWDWNCINGNDEAMNKVAVGDYNQLNFNDPCTQPWTPEWHGGGFEKHDREDLTDEFWDNVQKAKDSGLTKFDPPKSEHVKYDQFNS